MPKHHFNIVRRADFLTVVPGLGVYPLKVAEVNSTQNFAAVMASKGDQELLQMLAEADDYAPEAIEAVRVELKKRQLSGESAVQFHTILEASAAQELCPHCLKVGSFPNSPVCACCGCDKRVVRFRCNRCARELSVARSLSGALLECSSCGAGVVIPEETTEDLIIESAKTPEEYSQDILRLKLVFLKAGMAEEDWEPTLADLVAFSPNELRDHLHKKHVPCATARAAVRAIEHQRPALEKRAESTINKNILIGGAMLGFGVLAIVFVESGSIKIHEFGFILWGAVQVGYGFWQAIKRSRKAADLSEQMHIGPRCVCCNAPLSADPTKCHVCGWTQPRGSR